MTTVFAFAAVECMAVPTVTMVRSARHRCRYLSHHRAELSAHTLLLVSAGNGPTRSAHPRSTEGR